MRGFTEPVVEDAALAWLEGLGYDRDHGVDRDIGAGLKPAPTTRRHALPEIVRGLKTFSSRHINESRQTPGVPVWQRNYYEHVIRNEDSLDRIRLYIAENPARWAYDRENPEASSVETKERWEVG
jgi:hypothetical protein